MQPLEVSQIMFFHNQILKPMDKEFIPHKLSFELKSIGFDEPCFGYHVGLGDNKETPFKFVEIKSEKNNFTGQIMFATHPHSHKLLDGLEKHII
jgi:hypothetical protein